MKIKFHIINLLFVLNTYSYTTTAQNYSIDSLKKVLLAQKDDSNKVNTLNKLSLQYTYHVEHAKFIECNNLSLALSEKLGFKRGKADAYLNLGFDHFNRSNNNEARKFYNIALKFYEEAKDKTGAGKTNLSIAGVYSLEDNYAEAFNSVYAALKKFEEAGDKQNIASCYQSFGNYYYSQNNFLQALDNYMISLKYVEESGDKFRIASLNGDIAAVYLKQGKYQEALKKDSLALFGWKELQSAYYIAEITTHIGNIYENQGTDSLAMGNQLAAKNKFNEAKKNYLVSLELTEDDKYNQNIAYLYISLGRVHTKLKEFKTARNYLQKGLQFSDNLRTDSWSKDKLKESYKAFAELDSAEGNYKDAYSNYKMYIIYRDSLSSQEIAQKALQTKLQYDFDKKEAMVKAAQDKKDAEQKRVKNLQYLAIASLGILVLAVLVIAFIQFRNYKQKQKANLLLEKQKQKVENALTELKSTQNQLIQSEKMASLGELTAGIAHEIQNPLNFVNNFSEVNKELLDEMENELNIGNKEEAISIARDIKENEEKINYHGKRADAIVKGMLQHSRSSSGIKEPNDINALADEYLRLAYHGFRAKDKTFNATLQTNFDESIRKINMISQDIGSVLLNLYNNAFYAVNEKKKRIGEGRLPDGQVYEPTISVSTKKINDKIQIRVRDNGNGIPQKVIDKIYQPFFTTKPTGQGTGLGLSLSYDIIKTHGGEIKAETKENEGAEFTVILPVN